MVSHSYGWLKEFRRWRISPFGSIHRRTWIPRISKNSRTIPVIVTKDWATNKQGDILHVKRGFYRHVLAQQQCAVPADWQNIDKYANSAATSDHLFDAPMVQTAQKYQWIHDRTITIHRPTYRKSKSYLVESITVWDILEECTKALFIDLLPEEIVVESINHSGEHQADLVLSHYHYPVKLKILVVAEDKQRFLMRDEQKHKGNQFAITAERHDE